MNREREQRIINILHLSDFHFGIPPKEEKEKEQFKRTYDTILRNLRLTLRNATLSTKIDFVVISGDIAWQAQENGYNEFVEWINKLLEDIRVSKKSVIMCPGNHDFNRKTKIEEITKENQKELNLDNLHKRVAPFEFYQKVCTDIGIEPLDNSTENTKYLYGCRHFSNEGVLFAVFNSAWNELNDTNPDNRWLGDGPLQDVEDMVSKIRDTERDKYPNDELLVISVFHHPISVMNNSEKFMYDRNEIPTLSRMKNFYTAMILTGHVHAEIKKFEFIEENIAEFIGGTVFSKDSKIFNFEIISINIDEWKCTQHHGVCEGTQWYIKYDVKTAHFSYGKQIEEFGNKIKDYNDQQIEELRKNLPSEMKNLPLIVLVKLGLLEGFDQVNYKKRKISKKTKKMDTYQSDDTKKQIRIDLDQKSQEKGIDNIEPK
jgi:DNA repair exonuclease SbcCD nuclease subunit